MVQPHIERPNMAKGTGARPTPHTVCATDTRRHTVTTAQNSRVNCDLTYSVGEVDRDMPFVVEDQIFREGRDGPLLDAIYMPTQSHRPPPATDLRLLAQHSERIYLMFSTEEAQWARASIPGIITKKNLSQYFDLRRYLKHPLSANSSVKFAPRYDIPAKRTWALTHARKNGFATIGLLDDDIALEAADLLRVRRTLDNGVDMVSFHVLDYPDVSTIDHIERLVTRRPSPVSIGGNCLFLRPNICRTFFPFIYNEDWFFILFHLAFFILKLIVYWVTD